MKTNKGEIVIYKSKSGNIRLDVKLERETIWLTQKQIAKLFNVGVPAINKHLKNIFECGELLENSVISKMEITAADGKTYETIHYNLDAIISIGYRVNSKRATQFRIWATNILKNHIIKGYTLNKSRLLEESTKFKELQNVIGLLQEKSRHELMRDQAQEILDILANYSKSLEIFEKYDQEKLIISGAKKAKYILTQEEANNFVVGIKTKLDFNNKLFGVEAEHKFTSVIGTICQTFGGQDLYPSIEEKAANLLYLIIKDHVFHDGNKRLGSLLFIYFLSKNNYLYKKSGERKINDNALTALSLLVSISDPREKDIMIKLITNLLD